MGEQLPPWVDDESTGDDPPARRTRPWVLGLAVVPWLVVLGLVLSGGIPGGSASHDPAGGPEPHQRPSATGEQPTAGSATDGAGQATSSPPSSPSSSPTPPVAPTPGDDGEPAVADDPREPQATVPEPGGRASVAAVDDGPVGAIALAVARAWLTDVGPRLEVDGIEPHADLYLEHAAVERIERHGDHAVVSLATVVLGRDGEAYSRVASRRLAVPVALGADPRPAGAPWWLGEIELTATPPEPLVEVDDDQLLLSISESLTAAGISAGELLGAARTEDGWWLARIAAPDEETSPTPVWLRPGPDGPVVAGLAPTTDPREHEE